MIPLIALVFLALASAATGFAWQQIWGFYPLEPVSWRWAWQYALAYRHPPIFLIWTPFATLGSVLVAVFTIQILAARVRSRTRHGDFAPTEIHGSSHWASKEEVKETGLWIDKGVVVGGWRTATGIRPLRDLGPDCILLIAGQRSGKGVGPILSTLLSWTDSIVVNDIRGENWGKSAGWHAARGARVVKFSPAALSGSAGWNPLAEIRIGTDYEISDSQNVAMMTIDPDGTGLKDFWMKSGFAWLASSMLHVLYKVQKKENRVATLADVSIYLSTPNGDFEGMLKEMMAVDYGRETVNQFIHASAAEMLAAAHPERSGVHSSAKTELMLYRDPIIARNIAQSDFRISDIQNGEKPMVLYLVIPPNDLDRLRPLLRIFWNLLLRRLMQTYEADGTANHVRQLLLMFDEFTSVRKLDILEQTLPYMGGYGIKAFLVAQDLPMIERYYGRENSIIGLCKVKLVFAAADERTAKLVSFLTGETTVQHDRRVKSHRAFEVLGANVTDSLESFGRPLLTPGECMRIRPAKKNKDGTKILKAGEMLTFVTGHAPIRGWQPLYFKDKVLKARSKIPAPGDVADASPETDAPDAAGASIDDEENNQVVAPVAAPSIADRIRAAAQPHP